MDLFGEAWMTWFAVAAVAAIFELMLPGVFLGFVAIGAAITGVLSYLFPELGVGGQLISLAAWTSVAVFVGKRWYGGDAVETSDPLLNDRGGRLVGSRVVVSAAIRDGEGRVRIGDSEWPARGPDSAVDTRMRVVQVDGGVVVVESIVPEASPRGD